MYISELFNGRPTDCTGRLSKEVRVYDFLDGLGVNYQRLDHDVTATMEECAEVEKILDIEICKNLFLCNRQKTAYYLLMMPGNKEFHTKDLSAQIQSARLSFASAEDMEKYLDITPGSVSVLGLMNDTGKAVRLLIDEDVLKREAIGCHPCMNTSSMKIKTKDFLDKILPALEHEMTVVKL